MTNALFIDPDLTWVNTINRARERGMRTMAIQSERYAHAYPTICDVTHDHVIADTSDSRDIVKAVQTAGLLGATALLTSNDAILPVVATAAVELKIPFTSRTGVYFARNKAAMRQRLSELDFWMPWTETFDSPKEVAEVAARIGYPCVVKPCSGHQSWLCFKLQSSEDAAEVIDELEYMVENLFPGNRWSITNGFICEEWMAGPVMSVSMAAASGRLVPVSVALGSVSDDAPCAGFGSVIPFFENPRVSEECELYAIAVCRALNLDLGVFDLEMVWTSCGPVLIEVNARRMGGVMPVAYQMATGINFSDYLLDAYLDRPIKQPGNFTRSAVIRKVIASESANFECTPDETWWSALEGDLHIRNYSLESGKEVAAFEVLARLILVSSSSIKAFSRLDDIVVELERLTSARFLRGRLPWPQSHMYPARTHPRHVPSGLDK